MTVPHPIQFCSDQWVFVKFCCAKVPKDIKPCLCKIATSVKLSFTILKNNIFSLNALQALASYYQLA